MNHDIQSIIHNHVHMNHNIQSIIHNHVHMNENIQLYIILEESFDSFIYVNDSPKTPPDATVYICR